MFLPHFDVFCDLLLSRPVMYAHHLARLIIMRASFSRAEQPPFWRVVIHSNQAYSCVFLNGIKLKKYFAWCQNRDN